MTDQNNEQQGENRRKVAKTMLYKTTLYRKPPQDQEQPQAPDSPPEQKNEQPPKTKVAKTMLKTMLYAKPSPEQLQPQSPEQPQSQEPTPPADKPKTKVARTQLDHRMISNIQSRFGERSNQRLQEELANREPVKEIEPVEAKKKVASCPFSWTEGSAKDRVRYCGNCQKTIYYFDGLEQEQAEALVLKRENLEKFVLYARPDGKFMTSDCPITSKKRNQIIGLVAAVLIVVAASIAAFVMVGSQPPPSPTVDANSDPTASTATSTGSDTGANSSSSDTSSSSSGSSSTSSGAATSGSASSSTTHHYHAGDPIPPVVPSSGISTTKPPAKTFSEQEQKGDFWQYPNGQPADDFSRGAGTGADK